MFPVSAAAPSLTGNAARFPMSSMLTSRCLGVRARAPAPEQRRKDEDENTFKKLSRDGEKSDANLNRVFRAPPVERSASDNGQCRVGVITSAEKRTQVQSRQAQDRSQFGNHNARSRTYRALHELKKPRDHKRPVKASR